MQKTSLLIPIHSMVDLITNSSSEIFVAVKGSAAATIVKIIDGILAAGGSDKKCSDLFKVEMAKCYVNANWDLIYLTDSEAVEQMNKFLAFVKMGPITSIEQMPSEDDVREHIEDISLVETVSAKMEDFTRPLRTALWFEPHGDSQLKITALDPSNDQTAKLLSNLESLFDIEASYN